MARGSDQYRLFDTRLSFPNGFVYRPDFVTEREEELLLAEFENLPLENATFKEYSAKRRIINFGWGFEFDADHPRQGPPLPDFLRPLQKKVAKWLDVPVSRVVEALVTEYTPGTPIGWHRDRDMFESIVGVSLSGWCDMQLRPIGSTDKEKVMTVPLEPRSAYLMQSESRWQWQHHIPPTKTHRYSITFRTLPKNVPVPNLK